MGNSQAIDALHIGTCNSDLQSEQVLALPKVFYAADIVYNLLNIRSLALNNYEVCFKGTQVYVFGEH